MPYKAKFLFNVVAFYFFIFYGFNEIQLEKINKQNKIAKN